MDVVFTYVNGEDRCWAAAYAQTTGREISDIRCMDHGEIVLAVDLLVRHCSPWLNKVHIVHAGTGMKEETLVALERLLGCRRLHLVPQGELVPVPCYSSCSVEAHLHLIPDLSEVFLYCNDDMFVGRPLPLDRWLHPDGRPWVDMSAVPNASRGPTNLAQEHSENAYRLFRSAFPRSRAPHVHVAHFASVMVRQACRDTWTRFGDVLTRQLSTPVRTRGSVNFQLLAGLVAVETGLAHRRTRIQRAGMARALVEMEPEGLGYVLAQMPHHFCVNGVDAGNLGRFTDFARRYLAKCGASYPCISRWTWSSEELHQGDCGAWLANGDDRNEKK